VAVELSTALDETWVQPVCVPLIMNEEFDDYRESEEYFLCPCCVSTSEDDIGPLIFHMLHCCTGILKYVSSYVLSIPAV